MDEEEWVTETPKHAYRRASARIAQRKQAAIIIHFPEDYDTWNAMRPPSAAGDMGTKTGLLLTAIAAAIATQDPSFIPVVEVFGLGTVILWLTEAARK